MWSNCKRNSTSHLFWQRSGSLKLHMFEVSKVHWLYKQKIAISSLILQSLPDDSFLSHTTYHHIKFLEENSEENFPISLSKSSENSTKGKDKNSESIPSRLSIASLLSSIASVHQSQRNEERKKKEEKGKLHHQTQRFCDVAFFPISALYPSRVTHNIRTTTELSFIFSSFLHPKKYTQHNTKNPSRRPVLAESFSVDPSNGEHLHSFRVPEWLEILYCVEFSHSFSRRSRSDEWQSCAIRKGGNTSVTDLWFIWQRLLDLNRVERSEVNENFAV